MSERIMSTQQALENHLQFRPPVAGLQVFSAFTGVLRDVRAITGRNPDTGDMEDAAHAATWLGALGYLILLEQIGECFRPRPAPPMVGAKAVLALRLFGVVPEDHAEAIYALRNALAHDFGLCNRNPNHPKRQHQFKLLASEREPIVQLPTAGWDGDYNNRAAVNETTVNLWALGDLIEHVVREVKRLAVEGNLDVVLAGGSDELIQRYAVAYGVPPT